MSTESEARRVQQILSELERLQGRLENESREEQRAASDLAHAQRNLASASPSFKAMYQSDAERKSQRLLEVQRKRAAIQQELAAKSAALHRAQSDYSKAEIEESKRRRDADDRLRRQQEQREKSLREQLDALRRTQSVAPRAQQGAQNREVDLFVSHASEDKDEVVRPLVQLLQSREVRVWFDELVLRVGDSLRRTIDAGLAKSRFGVVVLSPSFFAKNWPQYELDGMVAIENAAGQKVILPVWHRLTKDEVLARSATLADRVALNTSIHSLSQIADELAAVVRDAA